MADAGLQVSGWRLVELFDLLDGTVNGIAEGVPHVLALVSGLALMPAQAFAAVHCLGQEGHLLLNFIDSGVIIGNVAEMRGLQRVAELDIEFPVVAGRTSR